METTAQKRALKRSLNANTLANAKGMTIVELMIVLTIIAAVMGMVGFSVIGALGQANVKEAQIEIQKLSQMVESYYLASNPRQFPNTLEDLTKGQIEVNIALDTPLATEV